MRKQDRIAHQQQNRPQQTEQKPSAQLQPKDREQMKGSASEAQRPPRQSGKLPLPD